MSLKNRIFALAEEFSTGLLAAVRSASLEEILGENLVVPARRGPGRPPKVGSGGAAGTAPKPAKSGKGGRLARRSPEQIAKVIESIVGALKGHKGGMRSEQLQKVLGLDKKQIFGPLNEALDGKKISKKGQRRATTYFAR